MSESHTWEAQMELPGGTVVETTVEVTDLEATRAQLEREYPGATIVLSMLPRNVAHVRKDQG
jgi:hypothetical protein